MQRHETKPQWSADGFFYQGTISPSLTQQIGGEGTLEIINILKKKKSHIIPLQLKLH